MVKFFLAMNACTMAISLAGLLLVDDPPELRVVWLCTLFSSTACAAFYVGKLRAR